MLNNNAQAHPQEPTEEPGEPIFYTQGSSVYIVGRTLHVERKADSKVSMGEHVEAVRRVFAARYPETEVKAHSYCDGVLTVRLSHQPRFHGYRQRGNRAGKKHQPNQLVQPRVSFRPALAA